MKEIIEKTIKALELNRMKGYFAESREELFAIVDSLIKDDKLITSGGSMTMKQCGLTAYLNEKYGSVYLNRDKAAPEEIPDVYRKAFVSDTFFSSTNAVTTNGELYNVDGNGNRVSAMIFGPKQVIVVCGTNKIVNSLDEAVKRVEETAAPLNTVRLNKNTPCAVTGKCAHCRSTDRICCSYVTLGQQKEKDRIKVIFLDESLGY